jgi:hypothetical protein
MEQLLRNLAKREINFSNPELRMVGDKAALVWQFVRHNKKYQKQYQSLQLEKHRIESNQKQLPGQFAESAYSSLERAESIFCRHWCISQPLDPGRIKPPRGFSFSYNPIRLVPSRYPSISQLAGNFLSDDRHPDLSALIDGQNDLTLNIVIDPLGDREIILSQINTCIETHIRDAGIKNIVQQIWNRLRRADNVNRMLLLYVACKYYRETLNAKPAQIKKQLVKDGLIHQNTEIRSNQVSNNVASFESFSEAAPWIFFLSQAGKNRPHKLSI